MFNTYHWCARGYKGCSITYSYTICLAWLILSPCSQAPSEHEYVSQVEPGIFYHITMMYQIARNFAGANFHGNASVPFRRNVRSFYLMATPQSTCTKEMTLNDEAKQACATMPYSFVWKPLQLRKTGLQLRKTGLLNRRIQHWLVEQKDSALLISTSTILECLLWVCWYFVYIVAGWVCFAATIYRVDI